MQKSIFSLQHLRQATGLVRKLMLGAFQLSIKDKNLDTGCIHQVHKVNTLYFYGLTSLFTSHYFRLILFLVLKINISY